MFSRSRQPINHDEVQKLELSRRRPLVQRWFGRTDEQAENQRTDVDLFEVSVEKCFILRDFNEDQPLYILDLGGTILILFGQWMFDPHTLIASKGVFDKWDCDKSFFATFSIRALLDSGTIFTLQVHGANFVKATHLTVDVRFKRLRECELFPGSSESLIDDLRRNGLIE